MRHDGLVRKKVCNYFVYFDPLGPAPQYRFKAIAPAPEITPLTERPKMFVVKTVKKVGGGAAIAAASVITAEIISRRLNMPDQRTEIVVCITALLTGAFQGIINLSKHWPRKG